MKILLLRAEFYDGNHAIIGTELLYGQYRTQRGKIRAWRQVTKLARTIWWDRYGGHGGFSLEAPHGI